MSTIKQIACISTHYWDDAWFRKQHFMHRFWKKGYTIAYIEPSFSAVKSSDNDKVRYQKNRMFGVTTEERENNLFIIKPPRGIPFWTQPIISRINYYYFSFNIANELKRLGFSDYILWNYRPEYAHALGTFKYKKLIFDIADDLAAYNKTDARKSSYVQNCMEFLVGQSDLVIVTAGTLYDKFRLGSRKIVLIPNGFDAKNLSNSNIELPGDLKKVPSPRIGFIGTIFSFLDYELIEYVVRNNRDKSFVFVGACQEYSSQRWGAIVRNNSNVFWLGKKPKSEISAYIKNFDVCINPFKVDAVSRSVSPLKVFEYLAQRKPVISVQMESLQREEAGKAVFFAKNYEDFNIGIARALKGEFKDFPYDVIDRYSWDVLFNKAEEALSEL